jgi:hypothetical protein
MAAVNTCSAVAETALTKLAMTRARGHLLGLQLTPKLTVEARPRSRS